MSSGKQPQYNKPEDAHSVRARMNAEMEMDEGVKSTPSTTPEKAKGEKGRRRVGGTLLPPFDTKEIHKNSFIIVVAPRRSGKSHAIQSILEDYTKKQKVDGVFLFTKTNAGFDGIPRKYRFKDLAPLNELVETQIAVKRHNLLTKKKRDKVSSNIVVILDDMVAGGGMGRGAVMRKSKILNKLAVNGRHLSSYDGESNMMVILISQIFTGIAPQIRRNADFVFATKIPSRVERKLIVEEFLCLRSCRNGLKESYAVFDKIVNGCDFNFIVIQANKSNKYSHADYVFSYKAPAKLENKRLCGSEEDWKPCNNRRDIYF